MDVALLLKVSRECSRLDGNRKRQYADAMVDMMGKKLAWLDRKGP